uniref:Uncharacterized protein n=1 Tax=Leersia perrieri TaxID=77586 RepID=A0A0D9XXM3_9ORYZ
MEDQHVEHDDRHGIEAEEAGEGLLAAHNGKVEGEHEEEGHEQREEQKRWAGSTSGLRSDIVGNGGIMVKQGP